MPQICGKNYFLKKLPQKVWQKLFFEKIATKVKTEGVFQ